MPDIDALGKFWWSDAKKGEGGTIPEKHVIGRLRSKDGEKITLELFGFLNEPPKNIVIEAHFRLQPSNRKIF